jgi:hypothetical protein
MTQFTAHFENSDGTETITRQFRLEDSELARSWFSAVTAGVTHVASAGAPTDVRKLRQWQIIRYHINQANEDHLLDEWIHFPPEVTADFQPLLNSIRLRAHAFELYAAANNQHSQTRESLLRVMQAIDAFEATVDPTGHQTYLRFRHSTVKFAAEDKTSTVKSGTIVLVQPPPVRTAYQMYRARDTTLLDKRLMHPWTSAESEYSMIVLNDQVELIDAATMPLCKDNYIMNNTIPVAYLIDINDMESISTLRIVKIEHENQSNYC